MRVLSSKRVTPAPAFTDVGLHFIGPVYIKKSKLAGHAIKWKKNFNIVGSVVEWLTHRTDDQHGLGSKPTCAILLCSWEKHFTALSPAWWS